ncbi:hypothetical protein BN997_01107 [Oceanobacillus oncorhynchi]|uniref:Uncharacterized protein n=1 Tax=Oceanobacillus oncorhynchi TaxID=545501 RepID=A0A0A1MNF9_9BACI|nr:DUF6731 family protein [Oceanobacillus oncorhynchi]CEI81289.1 hypothetical protein BN997_01107 [Oceanobacillus oncorhynchi]
MAIKYVRFNYFEPILVPADTFFRDQIEGEDGIRNFYAEEVPAERWDMSIILDYFMVNTEHNTSVEIGDEFAEIEPGSYHYHERDDYYYFQISKLRDNNIPAKKRVNEIKEDILLNQDEFIGEFVSLLFDNAYGAIAMQSNLYGVSSKQAEIVLTNLRQIYMYENDITEEIPLVVQLSPIIDRGQINKVFNSDYYKKVRIKGSDVMLDANIGENNLLSEATSLVNRTAGINFDITVSLGRSEKTASLNEDVIRELIEVYQGLEDEVKPKVELTALENEEAQIETVNLLEPRMTDRFTINIAPRTTVGHEYLINTFIEKSFNRRRPEMRRVMRP